METVRIDKLREAGIDFSIAQQNMSRSKSGVIRGLHVQFNPPMSKIVRVVRGEAYAVVVDLRTVSPTRGAYFALTLSEANRLAIYIPAGFAFGFAALSDSTDVQYLCNAIYHGAGESAIRWNDPEIGIPWPVQDPLVSEKDKNAPLLRDWFARPESRDW